MANAASSGTSYTVIATLVQLMGEDKAFEYMKQLHKNVSTYTRSGVAPAKAVARGETAVSISCVQDVTTEAAQGFPAASYHFAFNELLLRPCKVLSRIANPTILKVAHNALWVLLQHRHVIVGGFT